MSIHWIYKEMLTGPRTEMCILVLKKICVENHSRNEQAVM